ncbi:hypothetical protein [Aliivibrio fischeri]|uniref:hypothetical protein n=1 Tax=Aliivibrio fischeri TaxID=668 RepID=UPI0012D89934|nr:hypothetical protein [Aliivibrio fischeri]MUI56026.1 hypothetical protein [Aliivibrio fischeri]MUJ39274.1 hypothetical protein [Aliivibrio fischeri]
MLLLVAIVLCVCLSQNLANSYLCPLASTSTELNEQATANQSNIGEKCTSSEQLIKVHTAYFDVALIMFILVLTIISAIQKQVGKISPFAEPALFYRVRRHLAFCIFHE